MSLNVLIIDDSEIMRRMIKRTLNLSDVAVGEIYEAANGREGLLLLAKHSIDLALVDINMPVMNGEEMIERVRQNPNLAGLSIVVVSTEGSSTRIEKLAEKGIAFVRKPFSPEQLSEIILENTGESDEREH